MEFLRPVRWKEGLFLRPHHLQQLDLHTESRDIAYFRATGAYGWGLIRFEIQEESLTNFVLGVSALRAILPDGTLIDVPGNARLASRPCDPKMTEAGRPLDVAVGVRRIEERRPQSQPDGAPVGQARYAAVSEEVYDLEAGRDATPIERLEYDVRFFLADEPVHGYETLPVSRLSFTGDPGRPVVAAPGFAPPCLAIGASTHLTGTTRAVVERLALVLRRMREKGLGEDPRDLILFQALAGCLPVLKDMMVDGRAHPRRVYQELARLAGTLYYRDTVGRSFDDIPAYDHVDPGPVFTELERLIVVLSEREVVDRFMMIPMERVGDQYRAGLPPPGRTPSARLFLKVEAQESAPQIPILLKQAKISTPARMDTLAKFALPGISTEEIPGPPSELPPGQSGSFFRMKVESGNEFGNYVVVAGELAAFLLNAPKDVKLSLVVIMPVK